MRRQHVNQSELIYRQFRWGDEALIKDLYYEVFRKKRSIEQWKWEFMRMPEGPSNISVIEDDGQIIGHVALIPIRFQYFDKEIIAGKSEDSSLRKEYRGRNLFGKLEHQCFATAAKRGFSISYSISRTAREVHVKAGYCPLKPLQGYFVPLKPVRVAHEISNALAFSASKKALLRPIMELLARRFRTRCRDRTPPRADLVIEEIERFDASFDDLWRRFAATQKLITIKRSSKYLNWRFVDKPAHAYRIHVARSGGALAGYIITTTVQRKKDFKTDLRIGVTSDFLVLDHDTHALASLFDRAVEDWISWNCDCVINWIHRDSLLADMMLDQLKRYAFVSMFGRFSIPISVRALRNEVPPEEITDERNWFFTLAFCGRWA